MEDSQNGETSNMRLEGDNTNITAALNIGPQRKTSKEKSKVVSRKSEERKDAENINIIRGFPITCTLCKITNPFKNFTDVIAHLYGQRHRNVGWKMVYLKSKTSITFSGNILFVKYLFVKSLLIDNKI